ncbi:hypothetical protein EI94DRAFT_305368 [Lactarius quietus]|nr:hypothetical protein EI94DRAFT_305368 [Lactarius quietus]
MNPYPCRPMTSLSHLASFFTQTRYSSMTGDSIDFDDKVSTRTHAVMMNIAYLCKQNRIERMARIRSLSASLATATRISSCTLSTITALGNYRDGIALKYVVHRKLVSAYTSILFRARP